MEINSCFPRYTGFDPIVPVWCITPGKGGCLHRFFDTSPISPSQRYAAVLRMPFEDRLPSPGDVAEVVLIDLHSGEERVVAHTRGWEPQMGANINWGTEDTALYFNDVDTNTWEPFCVKLNPLTGESKRLGGTIYRISPDGQHMISACMKRMRRTQYGYGVMVPDQHVPRNFGFSQEDGLYITHTQSGERRLLVSIEEVFERAVPAIDKQRYQHGECYGFHCKYNPQGDQIIFTMRWFETQEEQPWDMLRKQLDYWVITMNADGSNMRVAVGPEQWEKGGHHINWFPNGRKLSMNLCIDGDNQMYLVQADADGSNMNKMIDTLPGSGHPTVHVNGRYILTDAYLHDEVAFDDGTVPIRWIDLQEKTEQTLVRIPVENPGHRINPALRVDPHPAWAPDHRHIIFNGVEDGTRRVYVADLGPVLGA